MRLDDPGSLRAFLSRHGMSARKGLGQHFLVSSKVVDVILARVTDCQGVLEIGPGPGILTGPLSLQAEKLIALEVDERALEALQESAPKAEVRIQDALEANLGTVLNELPEPRAVVSNLPYYITGPLITRIAEARAGYERAILMMQREVAQRVLAEPKTSERGSLSVFLQSLFSIEKVVDAPPGAFLPPPKVASTVLQLVPRADLSSLIDEFYFKLVRGAFTQPRKTLVNNLMSMGLSRDRALEAVLASGLSEKARPQELSLAEWLRLREAIGGQSKE